MSLKELRERILACEESVAQYKEELARLQEKLSAAEAARARDDEILASDNANAEARRQLDQRDAEAAELKKRVLAQKRRTQYRVRAMRAQLLHEQEDMLRRFQAALKTRHDDQNVLKNVLIPEAEQNLAALQEKARQEQEMIQHIQQEIEQLNEIHLDNLF